MLVNAILLCMEAYGCTASMKTSQYLGDRAEERVIGLHVRSKYISFTVEPIQLGTGKVRTEPTGNRLRFTVLEGSDSSHCELSFNDAPHRPLENRLSEIIVSIFVTAERRYREAAVHARQWLIQRKEEVKIELKRMEEEERRKEQERLATEAKQRVDTLLAQAADFHRAQTIRDYVSCVREKLANQSVTSKDFDLWAAWAIDQAEHLDPVSNGRVAELIGALISSSVPAR